MCFWNMSRITVFTLLLLTPSSLLATTLSPPDTLPSCPAITSSDTRLNVNPPLGNVNFVTEVDVRSSEFARLAISAENLVSFFENDVAYLEYGKATHSGVGPMDGVSIGQLQWNWKKGRGTLTTEFFKGIPESLIAHPNRAFEKQLRSLYDYSIKKSASNRSAAEKTVNLWRKLSGDSESILAKWLSTEGVKQYQDKLSQDRMRKAAILAKSWMNERGYSEDFVQRALVLFYNFNVHAGMEPHVSGLRDIWAPQVDFFRDSFSGDRQKMFDYIISWMKSCKKITGMTGKYDAFRPYGNALVWNNASFVASLDEEQVDMFALAFLYATRSITAPENGPHKGFHGYSQLDVLNRAGVIALDKGLVRGRIFKWSEFAVH